jgi:hypothetical protein
MLGDIAWAASPTRTTRPRDHGSWTTSSIGEKYGDPDRAASKAGTGSAKPSNNPVNADAFSAAGSLGVRRSTAA